MTVGSSTVTVTDDYGNTKTFNKTSGYVTEIKDVYGNKKNFIYSSNKLTSITYTPAGQTVSTTQLTFTYNAAGALSKITDATYTSHYVEFFYSEAFDGTASKESSGFLRRIEYSTGAASEYIYNGDGKLTDTTDCDTGYRIHYVYAFEKIRQVAELSESDYGQRIGLTYSDKRFNIRTSGSDDCYGNEDDMHITYLFDSYGRAICSYTTDENGKVYGTSYAEYNQNTQGSKKNNTLKADSAKGTTEENLVKNGGFEIADSSWQSSELPAGHSSTLVSSAFSGEYSHKLALSTSGGDVYKYQTVYIPRAGTYTLSAYVKTSSVASETKGAYIQLRNSVSEYVTGTTDTDIQNGWRRISVTHTFSSAGNYKVYVRLSEATGTAHFDNVQLENAAIESDYNFIQNGSVRSAYGWSGSFTRTSERSHSAKVTGSPTAQKQVYQTIPLNAPLNTAFMLSGWAKANSVELIENRKFGLSATFTYSDGTTEE